MRIIALLLFFWFSFFGPCQSQTATYDILITEMMIDPNPVIGLPNFEWVEIYNRTNQQINLEGFQFSSGSTRYQLPDYDLQPGEFIMICDEDDQPQLSSFGSAISINTFPSLTNGGDVVRIESPNDELIHEVNYLKSWYGDSDKDDGGYSLEMINPEDPCLASSNWAASEDERGATPAAINSQWDPTIPAPGIQVQMASIQGNDEIRISFDRIPSLDINEMDFSITPANPILDVSKVQGDSRSIILATANELVPSTVYTITISADLADCVGKVSGMVSTIEVVRSAPILSNDLIINEILFNPIGNESDYVELYNRSDKYLNVNDLIIGNLSPDGSGVRKDVSASIILKPQSYLVFTEDKQQLINRFTNANPDAILEIDLPAFSNDVGNVTILADEHGDPIIIDALDYNADMHNAFIDDRDGVALERIDTEITNQNLTNWHSAASSTGYGTPTKINSQNNSLPIGKDVVELKSKTFYPDGNRSDQTLQILFSTDRSDYISTIDVYDGVGNFIHQVANNQLLGRNDAYSWDGRSNNGQLQNAGVYIVYVRMVSPDGDLITKKLPCTLSRAL